MCWSVDRDVDDGDVEKKATAEAAVSAAWMAYRKAKTLATEAGFQRAMEAANFQATVETSSVFFSQVRQARPGLLLCVKGSAYSRA